MSTRTTVEVCMISAHNLPRPLLLKPHWFAVGWVDPNTKYCSKIDSSGTSNPKWRTKFRVCMVDKDLVDRKETCLTVEVWRRDPILLRESLHGSVEIPLEALLGSCVEEVGRFELRSRSSGKARGVVEVAVRVLETRMEESDLIGNYNSSRHLDEGSGISLHPPADHQTRYDHSNYSNNFPHQSSPSLNDGDSSHLRSSMPTPNYTNLPSDDHSYQSPSLSAFDDNGKFSSKRRQNHTPPPPPPPSNVGFMPTFFPPSGPPNRNVHGEFGAAGGAGALAAGAVLFGDDFMSNSNYPVSFGGGSYPGF